ncbi:uncharacterized protein LOC128260160 [Drosophila gunungcola]|uniref:CHK kinase-like domain-containing protein n=1 Tax=Drosophila gunungcola TaxID=103775 RepID=A0A9P9YGM1_9MUSC|nr:uncharacterized protein LOC128260160 [Drosophila gunungcola]KAI8036609.1 hypothetical protein M5D96_010410 [Drosophila gunungcola]
MSDSELSSAVTNALLELYQRQDIPMDSQPIAGVGENAYGQVLRVSWPTMSEAATVVVKMAPKNEARRSHMHVVDYYAREVFMYVEVFPIFRELSPNQSLFTVAPALQANGLEAPDEFLIFEDLSESGFRPNSRSTMPTYDIVMCSLKALAELHACSFILQKKNPAKFRELVEFVKKDNLFTDNIEEVTIEFGKAQLRKARTILNESDGDHAEVAALKEVLERCEKHLKSLALYCVDGRSQAPHAVICHGDFWNNNILYRTEPNLGQPVEAKLIDFQMSRYGPPVLDIVHYLFACTEKQLRDEHFSTFMNAYYDTLDQKLSSCDLHLEEIYPRSVFNRQLQLYGVYGLIMGAFSLPFFISNASEVVDIDTVSEAIQDLSTSSDEPKYKELIEEFEMLNVRTLPIFKRRITGIVRDLIKYEMTEPLYKMDS